MKTRYLKDFWLNTLTYVSSAVSVLILVLVFTFVFTKGFGTLNLKWFTNDYWSVNLYLSVGQSEQSFTPPDNLPEGASFSTRYGFAVIDKTDEYRQHQIVIVSIDPASPLKSSTILTPGDTFGQASPIKTNMLIQKIAYVDQNWITHSAGAIVNQSASELVTALDQDAQSIVSAYIQTIGGGIRGSLIATLWLILLSLAIALPIGIMSAIYLNEYAAFSKLTPFIRSSIELLTGVPSIIFGLMGMLVLYPITASVGAQGTSILLGAMTLSIVLLPTIIRSTEESLKTVPDHFRSASLSLGANRSQTIFKIVLPSAVPGILTGVLLSGGRIIGESAALIYTMGTFVNDHPSILSGGTSLAVQIWSVMGGEAPNFQLASAISIVILAIVLTLNVSVKFIAGKLRKTW